MFYFFLVIKGESLNVVELIQSFILGIQSLGAESVEPDEAANYEPSYLDLHTQLQTREVLRMIQR